MNWKVVLLGGLAFFVATQIVSFITGQIIHTGILETPYDQTASFWRPELNEDPPNMAALAPLWIFNGAVGSLVIAAIYGWIRPAFRGPGWRKGLNYAVVLSLLAAVYHLGWSGVFNLDDKIWFWWTIDALVIYAVGATVLGWVAGRLSPES